MNKEIEHRLLSCQNVKEFVAMFLGLGLQDKLSVFTEEITVEQGAKFYRIRKKSAQIKDPKDPKEWNPVPKGIASQGRFNAAGESVLYVASSTDGLEREVRLKEGEKYYLATYECNETFQVGSFLSRNSMVNTLIHKIAMSVSGSEELTESENELIDEYYKTIQDKNLQDISLDMLSSLYLYKLLPDLYDTTNKLGKLILKKNECGIRYSSVYYPIELSGLSQIVTLDGEKYGNYVLTQKGFNNIEFISCEEKTCGKINGLDLMIETFAKQNNM